MPTRRRFKQRKGLPSLLARLFSSNAIPYASVTLPANAPSTRCRRRLTLSFSLARARFLYLFPSSRFLVFLIFLAAFSFFYPPFPRCPLSFTFHPYVDISLSIDPQGGTPSPSRRSVRFSFISLFLPFDPLYDERARLLTPCPLRTDPSSLTYSLSLSPASTCSSLTAVSLLSIRSLRALSSAYSSPFDVGCTTKRTAPFSGAYPQD